MSRFGNHGMLAMGDFYTLGTGRIVANVFTVRTGETVAATRKSAVSHRTIHHLRRTLACRAAGRVHRRDAPGAFNAIIAMSPSLQVDNGHFIEPYARATSSATVPLRLFATSGGYEPSIDLNIAVYAAQLRRGVSHRARTSHSAKCC